jgi:hypothetical protein
MFRVHLDRSSDSVAGVYRSKNLPAPRKYGYRYQAPDLKSWFGQTYLEEVSRDQSVSEIVRLNAAVLVGDIHKAEYQDWTEERRLMRVALEAMKKYDRTFAESDAPRKD